MKLISPEQQLNNFNSKQIFFVPWFTIITFTVITNYYESKFLLDPTKYHTMDKTIYIVYLIDTKDQQCP